MDAIIVTYNSARDLARQLRCEPLRAAFDRIVVVDNNSTDSSVSVAEQAGVEVLRRQVNDGFAAAVNAGVLHCSSDLVAVLNPDVFVDDVATVEGLDAAFVDPTVGLVAPRLRLPDGSLQDSARTIPSPLDLAQRRLRGDKVGALETTRNHAVPWVVGAFVVVRRSAFASVNGFDERYRLYFEDVDFCVRLWSAGWQVLIAGDLEARHDHQGSSRKSLFGWAMRRHAKSAWSFYAAHPDLLTTAGRARLVRRPRSASHPQPMAAAPLS